MFPGVYQVSSNINGNAAATTTKTLFGGYSIRPTQMAIFKDGSTGPVVYFANAVAATTESSTVFPVPILCSNGLYVVQGTAASNINVLLG